jgi:ribulose-5-phosphate 4-epimerase/fuculose-1-phosphate aldolase
MTKLIAIVMLGALVTVMTGIATMHPLFGQAPPSSAGPVDPAIIEDLVAANRILAKEGVLDAFGHVSIRHPKSPDRYLQSRSRAPALIGADDIMEFDLDSNAIDLRGRSPFGERFIHGQIYKARPDVNAIIHSHSPSVIPFSVSKTPLRPIAHTATFLYGGVPIFDIKKEDLGKLGLLVSDNKLGAALAAKLSDRPVMLMRGHGNVVVGPNVARAVLRAIYTELNAKQLAVAISLGGSIKYISAEEAAVELPIALGLERAWEIMKRGVLEK